MHIKFIKHGLTREVKAGFSWTVLFFGAFPMAFRGMWGWFFGLLVIDCITFGLFRIIFAFLANKKYAHWLAENGWTVLPNDSDVALHAWGIRSARETAILQS